MPNSDLRSIAGTGPAEEKAGAMAAQLLAVIHGYDDQVPVALVIGVLEIVKAQIVADASD